MRDNRAVSRREVPKQARPWTGPAVSALLVLGVAATPAPARAGVQYLHQDALGSVRVVTDENGNVVSRHDYLPFGEEIPAGSYGRDAELGYGGGASLRPRFTGKERDSESRLDYFGARYFSAAQGRFTTADAPFADQSAADPQSWNLYAYVRNNPLRYADPTGKACFDYTSTGSCLDYLVGVAKGIGNAPAELINAPTHLVNWAISSFTDYRFSEVVPTTFPLTSADQRLGSQAADVAMMLLPVAEAASGSRVLAAPSRGVRASDKGIQRIEGHLSRPELEGAISDPSNAAMIGRLKAGEMTPQDLRFYFHELRESTLMSRGIGARDAHLQTLEWQGIPYKAGYEAQLYHPDVILRDPSAFSPAAVRAAEAAKAAMAAKK